MQQSNSPAAIFAREARRIERLRRAAWGVMRSHPMRTSWPAAERSLMVAEWVEEALEARRERMERASHAH